MQEGEGSSKGEINACSHRVSAGEFAGKDHRVSKQATITVRPSSEHPEYLTVHDAMMQIADAFALLKGLGSDGYDWRLVSATTNSPFVTVGELIAMTSAPPGLLADAVLRADEAFQGLSDVLDGDQAYGDFDVSLAKKILTRNLKGVGLTRIELDGFPELIIVPERAAMALEIVNAQKLATSLRRARGSVEGELVDAGHHRGHPALKVKERGRGRVIWCRIPENLEEEFAGEASLRDVWNHARVRLRGWIEYSQTGAIASMTAETIQHVRSRPVASSELFDRSFTGGLDAVTYIDKLRDGDLG